MKKIETDGEVPKCDLVLATPSMMKELKTLGKIFRSKMPIERKGLCCAQLIIIIIIIIIITNAC